MNERSTWAGGLAVALTVAAVAGAAPGKKGLDLRWPVDNPAFGKPDFHPTNDQRELSGIFGPRLKWGDGRYDHHEGFDFHAFFDPRYPQGDHPVRAILPGVVSEIIDPPNPERVETERKVVVTHELTWADVGGPREWGPIKSGYLHLSKIEVQQGQRLDAGDELGRAGESGYTTTVHLHLNLYRAGGRDVNVNPARLFSPKRFPADVVPLDKRAVEVEWLERDRAQGTALARVILPYNAYTLDGFAFQVEKDTSRVISFEAVTAEQRNDRDTGDKGLFPGLRLFPLRYNGGGALERVQPDRPPAGWPAGRYPVTGSKGVRLGFDVLATDVPADAKRFKLVVLGVQGEKVAVACPGFAHEQ